MIETWNFPKTFQTGIYWKLRSLVFVAVIIYELLNVYWAPRAKLSPQALMGLQCPSIKQWNKNIWIGVPMAYITLEITEKILCEETLRK